METTLVAEFQCDMYVDIDLAEPGQEIDSRCQNVAFFVNRHGMLFCRECIRRVDEEPQRISIPAEGYYGIKARRQVSGDVKLSTRAYY